MTSATHAGRKRWWEAEVDARMRRGRLSYKVVAVELVRLSTAHAASPRPPRKRPDQNSVVNQKLKITNSCNHQPSSGIPHGICQTPNDDMLFGILRVKIRDTSPFETPADSRWILLRL
jgi:hypothetical protein